MLAGVREELAWGHRQQVVKSKAHPVRVLNSDAFLSDLEQSSKLACAGVNDIITCISICYADSAEERWIQYCFQAQDLFCSVPLCGLMTGIET